jgi:hypothetical protein
MAHKVRAGNNTKYFLRKKKNSGAVYEFSFRSVILPGI